MQVDNITIFTMLEITNTIPRHHKIQFRKQYKFFRTALSNELVEYVNLDYFIEQSQNKGIENARIIKFEDI